MRSVHEAAVVVCGQAIWALPEFARPSSSDGRAHVDADAVVDLDFINHKRQQDEGCHTARSCTSPEIGGVTCTASCLAASRALYQSISEGSAASVKV